MLLIPSGLRSMSHILLFLSQNFSRSIICIIIVKTSLAWCPISYIWRLLSLCSVRILFFRIIFLQTLFIPCFSIPFFPLRSSFLSSFLLHLLLKDSFLFVLSSEAFIHLISRFEVSNFLSLKSLSTHMVLCPSHGQLGYLMCP